MGDDNHLNAINRQLRQRISELERQLLDRDADPGRAIAIAGEASLVDQMEAMLAFEPATLYVLDRTGTLVHVTARTDRSALVGTSAFDVVHPDSRDEYRHRLDQVLAVGEAVSFQLKARDDDADARWYRARLSPWRSGGVVVGAIAVCAIMDRARQARIETERFRAILEQANEAIFVVDPRSGRHVDVNRRACELLGYTRAELLDLGLKDIETAIPLHSREQWTDHMIEIMASGPLVLHGTHRRKDGSTFPVESTLSIKPFEGDEYLLVVCRDMTEANRIKASLRQAEDALRVNDRLTTVGTLTAGVAHEINNPLAYVMGNIEFATDQLDELTSLPDQVRMELSEALAEARHGAARMSRIVRDLRTFSRRDDDSVGPVAIGDVLDSSINIAMNEIRPRAQLTRDYAPGLIVIASEPRLGQVFLTLLINAARAIRPGNSRRQYVRVRTARHEGRVVVDISDTGPGMTPGVAARIFEPYIDTNPVGTAAGFGLSIAHNIVTTMGGTIAVHTELGNGTTFRIELPPAPDGACKPSPRWTRSAPGAGRILIIDDNERTARALGRILHAHDVDIEQDRDAAIRRALDGAYHVIFCDVGLPDCGGIDMFRAIHDAAPAIAGRIVFVTDGTHPQNTRAFLDTIANDTVSKPYDATLIRRLVTARVP